MNIASILIALDSSSGAGSVLKAAAELALKVDAELQAIYIEDVEWFQASRHIFTQQISSYTGEVIPFSEQNITEQSRALNKLLQTMFSDMGRLMNLRYSYRSVKGVVTSELMEAASRVDLVFIGRSGRPFGPKNKVGSTARELVESSAVPVIVWNAWNRWPNYFIGICTTPEQSGKVIDWTINMARLLDRKARLFWPAEAVSTLESWEKNWKEEGDDAFTIPIETVRAVSEVHREITPRVLHHYRNELLIISRDNLTQNTGELLESLTNTVLLI